MFGQPGGEHLVHRLHGGGVPAETAELGDELLLFFFFGDGFHGVFPRQIIAVEDQNGEQGQGHARQDHADLNFQNKGLVLIPGLPERCLQGIGGIDQLAEGVIVLQGQSGGGLVVARLGLQPLVAQQAQGIELRGDLLQSPLKSCRGMVVDQRLLSVGYGQLAGLFDGPVQPFLDCFGILLPVPPPRMRSRARWAEVAPPRRLLRYWSCFLWKCPRLSVKKR